MTYMRKEYVISKIEAPQDGSPYVYVAFVDPNDSKSGGSRGFPQSPYGGIGFSSPEDLMKNLPKAMSNMLGGSGMLGDSPTFKISMREYEDLQLKVGDRVTIDIKKQDRGGV